MFNFFRKKPSNPAPAPEPLSFEDELPSEPVAADEPAPTPPPVEAEAEPMLTFEEWDRILAEEEAAKAQRASNRRARRPGPQQVRETEAAAAVDEVDAEAPPAAPAEPEREETPLEAALRRCEADPYDASLAHDLARLAYAEKQPQLAVAPLVKTAGLLLGSDWSTSAELLTRLLMMKQDTVFSDLMLADIWLTHDRMREAEQALRAALAHDPANHTATLGMIRVSLAARRAADAIDFCHHALATDANDVSSWEHLGDAHALSGNVETAAEHWLTAARLFAHQDQIGDAIRVYSQILVVQPEHPSAAEERANLGYVE